jgi:hypothetical protein
MVTTHKPTKVLRWVQASHTIVFLPLMAFTLFTDIFVVRMQSGQSIGISAHWGMLGDYIYTMSAFVIIAQIISIWRISSISIIIYAWFGSWLALVSIAGLTSAGVFGDEVRNLQSLAQWILDFLQIEYDISQVGVEVGEGWIYLLIGALSLLALSVWLFIEKYRQYIRKSEGLS